MAKPKRKPGGKVARAKRANASIVREGGTHLNVRNSGLEVWLYDDAGTCAGRSASASEASKLPPLCRTARAALRDSKKHPMAAPRNLDECVAALDRFLRVAFD